MLQEGASLSASANTHTFVQTAAELCVCPHCVVLDFFNISELSTIRGSLQSVSPRLINMHSHSVVFSFVKIQLADFFLFLAVVAIQIRLHDL